MAWSFKILSFVPSAGEFEEVFFEGDQSGSFKWIIFSNGMDSWCGVFPEKGLTDHLRIFIDQHQATVLAGGVLYIIDLVLRKALLVYGEQSAFQDLIADGQSAFAVDGNHIYVFEHDQLVKVVSGYYFDLFKFVKITSASVFGSFYQYGGDWTPITLDRVDLEIVGREA